MGSVPDGRYEIRTARLSLRPVSTEDLDALHRLWTDPDVRRFFWDGEEISSGRAEAAVAEAIAGFGRHGFGLWVAEGDDGGLLGFCGLRHLEDEPRVEVLYGVAPPEWGRGLATEMASAMLRFGFERAGLPVVVGIADVPNIASRRVLEKCGMTFERIVAREGREEARYSIRREAFRPAD